MTDKTLEYEFVSIFPHSNKKSNFDSVFLSSHTNSKEVVMLFAYPSKKKDFGKVILDKDGKEESEPYRNFEEKTRVDFILLISTKHSGH